MNARKLLYFGLVTLLILGFLVPTVGMGTSEAAVLTDTAATTDDEIIYIDPAGCIKILDTNQLSSNHQLITFDTALFGDCGWTDIATGDFNNDGEAEIVAVGEAAGSGKLTIFDPVYRGTDPEGSINQVPWKRIYTMSKSGSPITVVGAGNMNINVPGDEIFIGYNVNEPNNINHRIEVLIATNTNGTAWTTHINKAFGGPWESVAVGNINNSGSDDVVLIRNIPLPSGETSSLIEAHQIDNDFAFIWGNGGTDRQWTSAAIGQIYAGGTGEVLATRKFAGYAPSATFFIFSYTGGTLLEAEGDALAFFPYPEFVFTADINGSGDEESFFMRDLPAEAPSTMARVVMRNRGGDTLPSFELPLADAGNAYYKGFGADVDADGKDEVILMRSENVRIYHSPDVNQLYDQVPISAKAPASSSDKKNSIMAVANVDGTGYTSGARLTLSPDSLFHTLQAGQADNTWLEIDVTNSGTSTPINFTITPPVADWILEFQYTATATPAKLRIKFNASDLEPGQYFGPRITLTTTDANVLNPTVVVPIILTVTPANFNVDKSQVTGVYAPGATLTTPMSTTLTLSGTSGVKYTAGILSTTELRAAQAAFDTPIIGGYADETGQFVLKDAAGYIFNTGVAAIHSSGVSAAAVSWPSGVPWVAAVSANGFLAGNTKTGIDTMVVGVHGDKMTNSSERAVLVLVADAKAGDYPDNVRFVDLQGLKATHMLQLPSVFR